MLPVQSGFAVTDPAPATGAINVTRPASHFCRVSKKNKAVAGQIDSREAAWQDLVILCRKCGGKLKGGFGDKGRDNLRSALRDSLREAGRRRDVRIIETDCLGICPKGGVVAMRGSEPGRILIVPQGQAAGQVLETLGVTPAAPPVPDRQGFG